MTAIPLYHAHGLTITLQRARRGQDPLVVIGLEATPGGETTLTLSDARWLGHEVLGVLPVVKR